MADVAVVRKRVRAEIEKARRDQAERRENGDERSAVVENQLVNHLGASAERMNPNAALRLHVDLAPRVTASLVDVGRR